MEVGHCSLAVVAEAVHQQVGFDVVLLDSKAYPILEGDSTNSMEFWKSNRKVLAASKTLYTKLTGTSTNHKRAITEIDLTSSDDDTHQSKRSCLSSDDKLDRILEGVETLRKQSTFFAKLSAAFECVICKDVMHKPQFSPCCKHVVGCEQCVSRWFYDHETCPHCSISVAAVNYSEMKGVDDLLSHVRTLHGDSASVSANPVRRLAD